MVNLVLVTMDLLMFPLINHVRPAIIRVKHVMEQLILIAKLANWAPIREGDILFTGTPSGVGPLSKNDEVTASLYIESEHILSHYAKCV